MSSIMKKHLTSLLILVTSFAATPLLPNPVTQATTEAVTAVARGAADQALIDMCSSTCQATLDFVQHFPGIKKAIDLNKIDAVKANPLISAGIGVTAILTGTFVYNHFKIDRNAIWEEIKPLLWEVPYLSFAGPASFLASTKVTTKIGPNGKDFSYMNNYLGSFFTAISCGPVLAKMTKRVWDGARTKNINEMVEVIEPSAIKVTGELFPELDSFIEMLKIKPKNILLYGEPGNGKTTYIEMIAKKLNRKIFRVHGGKCGSIYLNGVADNLKKVIKYLKENTNRGDILNLEEFETLAKDRSKHSGGSGENSEGMATNTFIELMNIAKDLGLCVMGTTNNVKYIDEAVQRRFENLIEVQRPTEKNRLSIIKTAFAEEGYEEAGESASLATTAYNLATTPYYEGPFALPKQGIKKAKKTVQALNPLKKKRIVIEDLSGIADYIAKQTIHYKSNEVNQLVKNIIKMHEDQDLVMSLNLETSKNLLTDCIISEQKNRIAALESEQKQIKSKINDEASKREKLSAEAFKMLTDEQKKALDNNLEIINLVEKNNLKLTTVDLKGKTTSEKNIILLNALEEYIKEENNKNSEINYDELRLGLQLDQLTDLRAAVKVMTEYRDSEKERLGEWLDAQEKGNYELIKRLTEHRNNVLVENHERLLLQLANAGNTPSTSEEIKAIANALEWHCEREQQALATLADGRKRIKEKYRTQKLDTKTQKRLNQAAAKGKETFEKEVEKIALEQRTQKQAQPEYQERTTQLKKLNKTLGHLKEYLKNKITLKKLAEQLKQKSVDSTYLEELDGIEKDIASQVKNIARTIISEFDATLASEFDAAINAYMDGTHAQQDELAALDRKIPSEGVIKAIRLPLETPATNSWFSSFRWPQNWTEIEAKVTEEIELYKNGNHVQQPKLDALQRKQPSAEVISKIKKIILDTDLHKSVAQAQVTLASCSQSGDYTNIMSNHNNSIKAAINSITDENVKTNLTSRLNKGQSSIEALIEKQRTTFRKLQLDAEQNRSIEQVKKKPLHEQSDKEFFDAITNDLIAELEQEQKQESDRHAALEKRLENRTKVVELVHDHDILKKYSAVFNEAKKLNNSWLDILEGIETVKGKQDTKATKKKPSKKDAQLNSEFNSFKNTFKNLLKNNPSDLQLNELNELVADKTSSKQLDPYQKLLTQIEDGFENIAAFKEYLAAFELLKELANSNNLGDLTAPLVDEPSEDELLDAVIDESSGNPINSSEKMQTLTKLAKDIFGPELQQGLSEHPAYDVLSSLKNKNDLDMQARTLKTMHPEYDLEEITTTLQVIECDTEQLLRDKNRSWIAASLIGKSQSHERFMESMKTMQAIKSEVSPEASIIAKICGYSAPAIATLILSDKILKRPNKEALTITLGVAGLSGLTWYQDWRFMDKSAEQKKEEKEEKKRTSAFSTLFWELLHATTYRSTGNKLPELHSMPTGKMFTALQKHTEAILGVVEKVASSNSEKSETAIKKEKEAVKRKCVSLFAMGKELHNNRPDNDESFDFIKQDTETLMKDVYGEHYRKFDRDTEGTICINGKKIITKASQHIPDTEKHTKNMQLFVGALNDQQNRMYGGGGCL